jgi:glycosyltransferase involved in cell wall biosynthesis
VKLSIIVSTYNRLEALEAVLVGLASQHNISSKQWEVLIADDGSGPETAALVMAWASRLDCPLTHVWHEDNGFRLSSIRNLTAKVASGDWLVFLDGDCIPFSDFVSRHVELAEKGYFVAGNRILLSETYTAELRNAEFVKNLLRRPWPWWMFAAVLGRCNRWFPKFRTGFPTLRKLRPHQWRVLKGCNIGVWKSDFEKVNGFDESFSGWGREDSDFAIRMIRAGVELKDGRFSVPVLHMWHRENDRSSLPKNDRRLADILASNRIRAVSGVDKYTFEQTQLAILQKFAPADSSANFTLG